MVNRCRKNIKRYLEKVKGKKQECRGEIKDCYYYHVIIEMWDSWGERTLVGRGVGVGVEAGRDISRGGGRREREVFSSYTCVRRCVFRIGGHSSRKRES